MAQHEIITLISSVGASDSAPADADLMGELVSALISVPKRIHSASSGETSFAHVIGTTLLGSVWSTIHTQQKLFKPEKEHSAVLTVDVSGPTMNLFQNFF